MVNKISSPIAITVADFLSNFDVINSFTPQTFLDFEDNWSRIKRQYTLSELKANENSYNSGDFGSILIKGNTNVFLDNAHFYRDGSRPKQMPDVEFLTDYKAFMSSVLYDLLKDPKYVGRIRTDDGLSIGKIANNDITVFAWIRSLSNPGDDGQSGTWMNISSFVKLATTSVSGQGGSFSLSFAPIEAEYIPGLGWQPKSVVGYDTGDIRDNVVSQSHISRYEKGEFKRSNFYFHTVLQENDLILIKFEKLAMENERKISQHGNVGGVVSSGFVAGNIYDMIGLVDSVSVSSAPGKATVEVNGRDLTKMVIEDGSYFFPEQFAQNIFNDEDSLLAKRNRFELVAQNFTQGQFVFRTIETILKFIFNKFSNLGMVPNSALSGWGSRAVKKKYELKSSVLKREGIEIIEQIDNGFFAKEDRQGLWRITDFVFDPQVAKRVLADNSIATDNGSIINSIYKICQEPFVEFKGDTYRDRFYFVIKKPPFDAEGYRGMVFDSVKTDAGTKNVTAGERLTDIDVRGVENRFKLHLQETFGRNSLVSSLVIDINEEDVLSEPGFQYDQTAYSWYRLIPRGFGLDEGTLFRLSAVVALDEYAKIWGSKTFSLEYNYCPTQYIDDAGIKNELSYVEKQVYADLQFVIQSNAYLPFTRRGQLTMNGDRTIKRGMFVHYRPTGEIFYVDGVSHFANTDKDFNERVTTLSLSRGMRLPYIKGIMVKFPNGKIKKVSYFDIVNTAIDDKANINNADFLKSWKVDPDIFNFFIQKRQWA